MKKSRGKIKVLFMIDNLRGGGAERVLSFILRDLDRERFEASLFLVIKEGIYLKEVPDDVPVSGIFRDVNTIKLGVFRSAYRLYRRSQLELFKIFPALLSLRSRIKSHYDVGISFCEGHNLPLLDLESNRFKKTISWIHVDLRTHRCPLGISRVGCYAGRADKLFFVSEDARKGFLEIFPAQHLNAKTEVIYNPIDTKMILQKAEMFCPRKKEKFTLIAVGRLSRQKRFDKLIRVHRRLLDAGIDHRVWILGEGEERALLEMEVRKEGVTSTFSFLGFQTPYPYLKSADLFVMTSDYEGLPVALAEAMVLGKPIVSTRVTGPIELLENGKYGCLVENTEKAIEEGLKAMILDSSLREKYTARLRENKDGFIFPTNVRDIEKQILSL